MQHVNSKGNILDLVLKNVDIIQDLTVSSPPSLASDYFTITFSMKFGKQKTLKEKNLIPLPQIPICLTLTLVIFFSKMFLPCKQYVYQQAWMHE